MDRKDFLKGLGLAGLGTMIPERKTKAALNEIAKAQLPSNVCVLIPQETAGPYPFDLSNDPSMFRQNITEGNPGTQLNLTLSVVDINNNCSPVPNARIDIWHCNLDGYYSAFTVNSWLGSQNHVGETFFRGIQLTDVNGQAFFTTIYPGWYPGRAVHIHFQVFLNAVLGATSQMAFPDNINTQVNSTPLYAPHGQNATTNSLDGVFSDMNNTQYETVTIAANGNGGYDASLVIGLVIPPTGIIKLEPETGSQFKLHQNYPNPFESSTKFSFSLKIPSHVKLELFDVNGKKVLDLLNDKRGSGDHEFLLERNSTNILNSGSYVYQITVANENGTFRQCKMLMVH